MELNHTHYAGASSWVPSANLAGHDFPIQNLPFAMFRRAGTAEAYRPGIAIGAEIVDLGRLLPSGRLTGAAKTAAAAAVAGPLLNALLGLDLHHWSALRSAVFELLSSTAAADTIATVRDTLVPAEGAEFAVPTTVGDYTDFYTSLHHAVNIGKLFGIEKPSPNFYAQPIAYHGRSSTVVTSGTGVRRPRGFIPRAGQPPAFAACEKLDYELELGVFIGGENAVGAAVPIQQAESRIFGLCLLNDWSARDIQAWEMHPLGPFNAKNFATTISPWIVTLEALAPFRSALRQEGREFALAPHLSSPEVLGAGAIDVSLEVSLQTERGLRAQRPPTVLCATSFRHQYWTIAQMVVHHTAGGCRLRAGDLFGTGTVSGPQASEAGAIMELTQGGAHPVAVGDDETRAFLHDGDRVTMRGWCERDGYRRIGFGASSGEILAATA